MKKLPILLFILLSSLLHGASILIDFGSADSGYPTTGGAIKYNNITNSTGTGLVIDDLFDTSDTETGISLTIVNGFYGANKNGVTSGPYAANAMRDSLFDANSNWDEGTGDATVVLQFGGLDTLKTYDFTMFARRIGGGDDRSTLYAFSGGTSDSALLEPVGDTSGTTGISGMSPNGSGIITMTITPGETNNNGNNFIYLGTLEINAIPEPTTLTLMLSALGVLFLFRRRR